MEKDQIKLKAKKYVSIVKKLEKLEKEKEELRLEFIGLYTNDKLPEDLPIKVIDTATYSADLTKQLWIKSNMKLPVKFIPAHEEIDEAVLKVKAKETGKIVTIPGHRINLM